MQDRQGEDLCWHHIFQFLFLMGINRSKILLSIDKSEAFLLSRLRVHVTLQMQLTSESLWSAEEHAGFSRSVKLLDASKHHIPVRSTKVCWCVETSDSIVATRIQHDILRITGRDLGCKILSQVSKHKREGEIDSLHESRYYDACPAFQLPATDF